MRKQLAAAGLTAGLAVGGVAGFAFTGGTGLVGAQDESTTTPAPMSEAEDARPDRSERIAEILKPLVDDGTITQEQADKVSEALIAARPEGGFGSGRGDRGDHGGRGGHGFGKGIGLDAAAEALGMTADELKTELRDGTTVKELAEEKDVELSKVIGALVAAANERIDQAVENGRISEERAEEMKGNVSERITAFVNGERPEAGFGRPGRR